METTTEQKYLFGRAVLNSDETSKVLRVRGKQYAVEWFEGLSAADRGKLVEYLYQAMFKDEPK